MKTILVRYKLKPGQGEPNEALVRAVFEQLGATQPAGLHYASFKAADGLSFTHLAMIDTPDGSNPLPGLPAFKAFVADIGARCDEPPVATELTEVGRYRLP